MRVSVANLDQPARKQVRSNPQPGLQEIRNLLQHRHLQMPFEAGMNPALPGCDIKNLVGMRTEL